MDQRLNYAIILLGEIRIEGWVDDYDCVMNYPGCIVIIDGVKYRTSINNVLLMHKER